MLGALKPPDSAQVIKRLAERKRLTIAAGILCSDGIVICADSEENDYIAKYQAQKIRSFENRLLMSGAGAGPYIDMTFDKLRDALLGNNWPTDAANARCITEGVVCSVYEDHIKAFSDLDKVSMDLVVAIRTGNKHLALVGSCGTATYLSATTEDGPMAGGMVVVGGGRPLYEYWGRWFSLEKLTSEEVSYLNLFIIREVKSAVPGCGGTTYSIGMPIDDSARRSFSISEESLLLAGFPSTVIDALRSCMDSMTDDSAFDRAMERLTQHFRTFRAKLQQQRRLNPLTPLVVRKSEDLP